MATSARQWEKVCGSDDMNHEEIDMGQFEEGCTVGKYEWPQISTPYGHLNVSAVYRKDAVIEVGSCCVGPCI